MRKRFLSFLSRNLLTLFVCLTPVVIGHEIATENDLEAEGISEMNWGRGKFGLDAELLF